MTIPSNRKIILQGKAIEEAQGTETVVASAPTGAGNVDISIPRTGEDTGTVVFNVQPNVTESGNVSYFEIGDIRQAANLLVYMGSPSREFSIQGRFVSRTEAEAQANWAQVQLLRSWRLPEKADSGLNLKTPSRLRLSGLGKWFNAITVRMMSLSIETPEDVDYIRAPNGKDVPIVWPVSLSLKESKSIQELRTFNIDTFRQGMLDGW